MREDAGLSIEHFDICFEGEFYGRTTVTETWRHGPRPGRPGGSREPGVWRTARLVEPSYSAGSKQGRLVDRKGCGPLALLAGSLDGLGVPIPPAPPTAQLCS